jgi:hypothetical protein
MKEQLPYGPSALIEDFLAWKFPQITTWEDLAWEDELVHFLVAMQWLCGVSQPPRKLNGVENPFFYDHPNWQKVKVWADAQVVAERNGMRIPFAQAIRTLLPPAEAFSLSRPVFFPLMEDTCREWVPHLTLEPWDPLEFGSGLYGYLSPVPVKSERQAHAVADALVDAVLPLNCQVPDLKPLSQGTRNIGFRPRDLLEGLATCAREHADRRNSPIPPVDRSLLKGLLEYTDGWHFFGECNPSDPTQGVEFYGNDQWKNSYGGHAITLVGVGKWEVLYLRVEYGEWVES